MRRETLTAAWYGDCRLDGQRANLFHNPVDSEWYLQIRQMRFDGTLEDRTLTIPPPVSNDPSGQAPIADIPLYLRITDEGPLQLAGQGWKTGWVVQYVPAVNEWLIPVRGSYGVNPVIWAGQQLVHNTVQLGSQGLRYVAPNGDVISGDNTVNAGTQWARACGIIGPLWEWSHFDGLSIGQGDTGCIAEWQGKRYVLSLGEVYFIRVRRKLSSVCAYIVKPGYAEALWFDVSELGSAELPLEHPEPVPPKPQEPPPQPEPPKPEPPKPPKPLPPPVETFPPLKTSSRYWLHPNIDSADLVAALHAPMTTVDIFGLYVQWVLEDERWAKIDTLKDIRRQGVNLCIEMSCIMEGDPHGEKAKTDLPVISQRILGKGHRVCYLALDEPIYKAQRFFPGMPLEEAIFAIAKFVEEARHVMPGVRVGLIEPWPAVDLETQRKVLMGLDSWGCQLDFWHLDCDHHAQSPHATIQKAKQYADDYKLPLGVKFAGYPHQTDQEYVDDVVAYADEVHANEAWAVDNICIQSWATRGEGGPQDIPANLTPWGLFDLFLHVQSDIFQ